MYWTGAAAVLMHSKIPDNKFYGANMGSIWSRQVPDGPHVGSLNFAIWDDAFVINKKK